MGTGGSALRAGARRVWDAQPLTARGALVALLSGTALRIYGYGSLDLVVFAMGVSGLALVGLSLVAVSLTALALRRRVAAAAASAPRSLEAGSPIRTGFRLPALARVPLLQLRWEWREPAGVACRTRRSDRSLVEEVVATRRCEASLIRRRILVEDAFRLARVAFEHAGPAALTVFPDRGRLRQAVAVASFASADGLPHPTGAPEGDRTEIRRYAPGDPARDILWKVFARTRQLNVRRPERSADPAQKTVAYLVAGAGDEPAAAAARVVLELGGLGTDWIFGADGTPEPVETLADALQAIARSGNESDSGRATQLPGFLQRMAREGYSHCVVFAPARSGPWVGELASAARGRASLSLVLGTDGLARNGDPRALWRRLLFAEPPQEGPRPEELAGILRGVGAAARSAVVVDRATGRSFGENQQRAMGF